MGKLVDFDLKGFVPEFRFPRGPSLAWVDGYESVGWNKLKEGDVVGFIDKVGFQKIGPSGEDSWIVEEKSEISIVLYPVFLLGGGVL